MSNYEDIFYKHNKLFFIELLSQGGPLYKHKPCIEIFKYGDTHIIEMTWYNDQKKSEKIIEFNVKYDWSELTYMRNAVIRYIGMYNPVDDSYMECIKPSLIKESEDLLVELVEHYLPYKINKIYIQ